MVPTTLRALARRRAGRSSGSRRSASGGPTRTWSSRRGRSTSRAGGGEGSAGERGRGVGREGRGWSSCSRVRGRSGPGWALPPPERAGVPATLERCDRHVRELMGFSLIEAMLASGGRSRLDQIEVSLLAIIAFDVAMAELWRRAGWRRRRWWVTAPARSRRPTSPGRWSPRTRYGDLRYGRAIARLWRGAMTLWELPWERQPRRSRASRGLPGDLRQRRDDGGRGEPGALAAATRRLQADGIVPAGVDRCGAALAVGR